MSCMDEVLINDSVEEFRKVISSRTCNFLSESALLGPTRLRSIRKFIPKDDIWPTADSWDYHFLKNPYSPIPITCLEKEKIFARKFFGEFDSVQEFLKKGMMAHAELMRGEIDYTRVTPLCRGFMNWMYNDMWGCGTWSVVDYYFERKPAYYTMKRCFAPIYLPICESVNGIKAGVTNDTEKEISGELICRWKALDGRTLNEKKFSILVASDSVQTVDIDGLECDYISLKFIVDGKLVSKNFYFPNLWKDKSFITDIDWKMKKVDEGIYKITIKANAFARAVFVDTKDNEEITYSDNFFDMEKGDEVEVVIKSNLNLKKGDIKIKTFADVWKD